MILNLDFFENEQEFVMGFAECEQEIDAKFGEIQVVTDVIGGEAYDGDYEVTPAATDQTLYTAGKVLTENITVKKIPENYGLITYNQDRVIAIT